MRRGDPLKAGCTGNESCRACCRSGDGGTGGGPAAGFGGRGEVLSDNDGGPAGGGRYIGSWSGIGVMGGAGRAGGRGGSSGCSVGGRA